MLADARADIPSSVVDVVLARLHALPVDTVKALQTCSVIPGSVDLELATALLADVHVLDEAERRGMLIADGDGIRFRHELARAIEGSLTDLLRLAYHRRVLDQLVALDAPSSRVVHHATGARDIDQLLEHGVRAAREAAATGARRQAAEHFAAVLQHADRITPSDEALLRASHADELFLLNELRTAETEANRAIQLAEKMTDSLALADVLATLVPVARLFDLGDGTASDMARRVIVLLGDDPPAELEATACVNLASDLVLTDQHAEAAALDRARARRRGVAADARISSPCASSTGRRRRGGSAIPKARPTYARQSSARRGPGRLGVRRPRLPQHGRHAVPPGPVDGSTPLDRLPVTDSEEGEFFSGLARARSMRGGLNLYLGRWDEAEAELRELTTVVEPRSSPGCPSPSSAGCSPVAATRTRPTFWPEQRRRSPASMIPSAC